MKKAGCAATLQRSAAKKMKKATYAATLQRSAAQKMKKAGCAVVQRSKKQKEEGSLRWSAV